MNTILNRFHAQPPSITGGMPKGQGGSDTIMNEGTKRTLKRVIDIVIAVLTALITTISAHAAGIVR